MYDRDEGDHRKMRGKDDKRWKYWRNIAVWIDVYSEIDRREIYLKGF